MVRGQLHPNSATPRTSPVCNKKSSYWAHLHDAPTVQYDIMFPARFGAIQLSTVLYWEDVTGPVAPRAVHLPRVVALQRRHTVDQFYRQSDSIHIAPDLLHPSIVVSSCPHFVYCTRLWTRGIKMCAQTHDGLRYSHHSYWAGT